jgi:hypothetical protein
MLPRILFLPLLLLTALSSFAADTPEAVVQRQVDAMRAGDWVKFTGDMHGPALAEFQSGIVSVFQNTIAGAQREQMLKAFFGSKTIAELTAATPSDFFGIFMNGLSQTNPAIKQGMAGAEAQILGHIDEGPDKTHVLMRMTLPVGDGKVIKMDVTSLQREGDTWKALLKGDMQSVVTNLTRMLQPK